MTNTIHRVATIGLLGIVILALPDIGSAQAAAQESEEQTTSADPTLVELDRNLKELVQGRLPGLVELAGLFNVALDRLPVVEARLAALPAELLQLQSSVSQLEQRLADPGKELPPPQAPDILLAPPPTAPAKPAPDVPPDTEQPAEPVNAQADKLARQALENYQSAKTAHEAAMTEYNVRLEQWRMQIGRDLANARLQLSIAQQRKIYLTALVVFLKPMPEPARQVMVGLASPRTAVRERIAGLRLVAASLESLAGRVRVLQNRTAVGALVGFQVKREELHKQMNDLLQSLTGQKDSLATLGVELERQAARMEAEGKALRRAILVSVLAPDRVERLDALFIEQLKELRRVAKLAAQGESFAPEPRVLKDAIDGLVSRPEAVGSTEETDTQLANLVARLEDVNALVAQVRLNLDRWKLAFEREVVTVLSNLASTRTREQAYSLSTEFLEDLQADIRMVWGTLVEWAGEKWSELIGLPGFLVSQAGWIWLLRLALAIALVAAAVALRRRMRNLVARIVRWVNKAEFFRKHMGQVVRWSGFVHAVLPTLVFLLAGYCGLWMIGFEHAEVRFLEVAFFWLTFYVLGGQVLFGLTRQVSRGRPALIAASEQTVKLLRTTYGRLGLVMVLATIAIRWSRDWLGTGSLSALVRWLAWLWLLVWGLWAAFGWRKTLGTNLQSRSREGGRLFRIGGFMEAHRMGALLSPLAFAWLVLSGLYRVGHKLLSEGGVFTWLRARALRRLSKRAGESKTPPPPSELPETYVKEFPLYPVQGEEGEILLPREEQIEKVLSQLAGWDETRKDSSVVVLGEKGIGKTTLLGLIKKRIDTLPVAEHTIPRKVVTEKGLLEKLAPDLGLQEAPNIGVLASFLNKSEARVVLVDEAHNLFLREVNGYRAFDAMVRLVTYTSEKVFWVLVFNSFSWQFLNRIRNRVHYFRRLLALPPWSREQLQELINRRNQKTGFQIEYDEVLVGADRGTAGQLELIESSEGFFRLLHDASRGNPRVATHLWLQSLRPIASDRLRLGLFREESDDPLEELDGELLFALAAVCQHENLSVDELHRVLNVSTDFAGFAVRFLGESGYLEPKHTDPRRVTLAPRYYPQVLTVLRNKHLLFEKE